MRKKVTDYGLPETGTVRWTVARKAGVIQAVESRKLTIEAACKRYGISLEELLCWVRTFDKHGAPGLRATKFQEYGR